MAVTVVALLALAAGVSALLVRRWWLAGVAVTGVALAALLDGRVPRTALSDGLDAMALVAGMVFVSAAASRSGLLAVVAHRLTDRSTGARSLLAITFVLAVALTTVANLDTTAVLFTPVAVEIGVAAGLSIVPFALAAVLAANFGSMLLPTSNLTNLVVWRHTDLPFGAFAAEHAWVALGAVVVTVVAVLAATGLPTGALRTTRQPRPTTVLGPTVVGPTAVVRPTAVLGPSEACPVGASMGQAPPAAVERPSVGLHDPMLASASAAMLALLVAAFFAGLPVGPSALVGGVLLVVMRPGLWRQRIDLRLVAAALAVFGASGVLAGSLHAADHLRHVSPPALAALGAATSAAGTNLAATLTLVPAASNATLRTALLIGVNLGVGITPVASVATVLWRDSLAGRGLPVPWRRYFALAVPLSLVFVASSVLL